MPISWDVYERVALDDENPGWEMEGGMLRAKPASSGDHNHVVCEVGFALAGQLERTAYQVRINSGRVRCVHEPTNLTCYVPDAFVVPVALTLPLRGLPERLEVYDDPLPLVVEVWDPPTLDYDTDVKIRTYLARGDANVWLLSPYERNLTTWQRQIDGHYRREEVRGGAVPVSSLPGVRIDVDALFAP